MASQPSQTPAASSSQPRSSQPTSDSAPSLTRDDTAPSTTSVDSATVFLKDAHSSGTNARQQTPQLDPQQQDDSPSTRLASDAEPRKCWICFADETEDTPTTSAWKTPCSCALTAHEACLLDWVSDLEAPSSRRTSRRSRRRIECPQCKTLIVIARPHSTVVSTITGIEHFAAKLTLPGLAATIVSTLAAGCWVHGLFSMYIVFGADEFARMFPADGSKGANLRLKFGTALIPVTLVAARLSGSNSFLPMFPLVFLAADYRQLSMSHKTLDFLWPPSASMTFATLPYLQAAYNSLWQAAFAEKESKWIREVLPSRGEDGQDNGEGNGNNGDRPDGQDDMVQIELELEIGRGIRAPDHGPGGDEAAPVAAEQPAEGNAAAEDGANAANAEGNGQQAPAQGDNNALPARANRLVNSSGRIADLIMGALCFPTVAAVAGEVLRRVLPTSWTVEAVTTTTPSWWIVPGSGTVTMLKRPGLLRTRWGRTVVGGCLFVVLKDTLLLYSKYRLAQNHKKRHVVDYGRRKDTKKTQAG